MIKKSPPIYVSLFLASFTSKSGTCKCEDILRPLYYRGDNISKEVIKQSLHPTFDISVMMKGELSISSVIRPNSF